MDSQTRVSFTRDTRSQLQSLSLSLTASESDSSSVHPPVAHFLLLPPVAMSSLSLAPPSASALPHSSSASAASSSVLGGLKRSASGSGVDALTARRCWARLDQGSSGFVGAQELHHYLARFIAQQKQQQQVNERSASSASAAAAAAAADPFAADDDEEKKSAPASSASAAAASASASAASPYPRLSPSPVSDLAARAASLSAQAASVSVADLEELIRFCDVNSDGKLELEELLAALQAFNNPPVSLQTGRFESEILTKGLAGARPKRRQIDPATAGFRSHHGLGMGAPSVSPTPSVGAAGGFSLSASPQPPQLNGSTSGRSALGPLPSIFASASMQMPAAAAAASSSPPHASTSGGGAAAAATSPSFSSGAGAAAADVAASAAAPADVSLLDSDATQPMDQV